MKTSTVVPIWTKKFLLYVGLYYFLCGVSAIVWPSTWFYAAGFTPSGSVQDGLLLAVIGTSMLVHMASALMGAMLPSSRWVVVSILLFANILDLLLILEAGRSGELPMISAAIFSAIDLALISGLSVILFAIYNSYASTTSEEKPSLESALAIHPENSSLSLAELSDKSPIILVMIRHSGCTFCRENLERVANEKGKFAGRPLVIVGLSEAQSIRDLVNRYGLSDAMIVSDPEKVIYRALELKRGSLLQLFGVPELWSAFVKGALFRHGLGSVEGDPFQLPGSAIIHNRRVVAIHVAKSASDYCEIAPLLPRGGAA